MAALTPDQYLVALNDALQADPDYEPSMRFVSFPEGATGRDVSGYAWTCSDGQLSKQGVFARVGVRVASENFIVF